MEKRYCAYCGKELKSWQKVYCSRACRNRGVEWHYKQQEPKYEKVCVVCGKHFLAKRPRGKYCSDKCSEKAKNARKKVREGYRYKKPQGKIWEELRKATVEQQDNKCWLCGKPLPKRFELHHLDYGDHSVHSKRVVALCPACHNAVHKVMVTISPENEIKFYGKAIQLLTNKLGGIKYGKDQFR